MRRECQGLARGGFNWALVCLSVCLSLPPPFFFLPYAAGLAGRHVPPGQHVSATRLIGHLFKKSLLAAELWALQPHSQLSQGAWSSPRAAISCRSRGPLSAQLPRDFQERGWLGNKGRWGGGEGKEEPCWFPFPADVGMKEAAPPPRPSAHADCWARGPTLLPFSSCHVVFLVRKVFLKKYGSNTAGFASFYLSRSGELP